MKVVRTFETSLTDALGIQRKKIENWNTQLLPLMSVSPQKPVFKRPTVYLLPKSLYFAAN